MFLETDIMPALLRHETHRARTAKRLKFILIGIALLTLTIVFAMSLRRYQISEARTVPIWLVVMLGIVGASITRQFMLKPLKEKAKTILAGGLTGFLGWTFEAKDFPPMSVAKFRRLGLLPAFGTAKNIEDRICGQVRGQNFEMHELQLVTEGKNKTIHFAGQIITIDCSRKVSGETLVLREKGVLGNAVMRNITGMKRAGLVDPHFEKIFEVYTTDQVEARYLLPPDFMQSILDLEAAAQGKKTRFAFSRGQLIIAVETGNSFEPGSAFKTFANRAPAQKIIRELKAVHALIAGLSG